VTATYYGDSNYNQVTSTVLTQTVQSFIPTVTPAQLTMAQGSNTTPNTNLTDAYFAVPIQLTSVAEAGFADPIAVTSCTVLGTSGPAAGFSCAPVASPTAATGVAVVTATSAVTPGAYTVQYTVSDTASPALTQTASTTVTIINQAPAVFTPTSGSGPATFTLPSSLAAAASALSCNSSLIATSLPNGTYTTSTNVSFAQIGIQCSAITGPSANGSYTFTVIAGNNSTSAKLEGSQPSGITAALLGAPFLLLFGLLPASRKHRRAFLRTLGVAALAVVAMQVTGCASGGFTRTTPVTATSGSYLIGIINTQTNTTVAEVPLIIAN
jgi:hypothetical protein